MAMKLSVEFDNGFISNEAYLRINIVSGTKEEIVFTLDYYKDVTAYPTKKPIQTEQHKFTPSVNEGASNFIKQAYEYVKTLPKFADAVDC